MNDAPAMILLEDIDRTFPRTGESQGKVSLQQLLNCLDGVATGEGIVTVATANEPTILDPAILRRPGRFDRVVHFPNPSAVLRREYFCRMQEQFLAADLDLMLSLTPKAFPSPSSASPTLWRGSSPLRVIVRSA